MAIALPTHLQDGEAILISGDRLLQKMADGRYRALAREVDVVSLNLDQFKSDTLAWVTFDGRGATPTVLAKHGISGVLDLGVGVFKILLDKAYPDTTYGVAFASDSTLANAQFHHRYVYTETTGPTVVCASITNGAIKCDPAYVSVLITRDPAKM